MTLELRHVAKTFGANRALKGVDLTLNYGEVHGLAGQNGSGKSTLIKVMSGYHQPDPGSLATLDGKEFLLGDPVSARAAGLRFVHQDLGLVPSLSVLENVMLGQRYAKGLLGRIKWGEAERRVKAFTENLGIQTDLRQPIRQLPLAERSAVAIARALLDADGRQIMLVLDEPTAALPADEVQRLLSIIGRLREEGHGILLVSHHLDEVLQVADHVTVFRDGAVAASRECAGLDQDSLAELIVGHAIAPPPAAAAAAAALEHTEVLFDVRGLSGARVHGVDLQLRPGEILGVAGITGSGRESLAPLLIGRTERAGTVRMAGSTVPSHSPRKALQAGMASIPGDRSEFGIFPRFTVRENMSIADLRPHCRGPRLRKRPERKETAAWIDRLGIVTQGPEAPITSLSGGNQQKVLVARALRTEPKVLILDDPTLGIDIGARAQIHDVIRGAAADGMAVLLVSSDADELAQLATSVAIMGGGRIVHTLSRSDGLTPEAIEQSQLAWSGVDLKGTQR